MLILSFLLIVVMLGIGMVIPIFPFYVDKLDAGRSLGQRGKQALDSQTHFSNPCK